MDVKRIINHYDLGDSVNHIYQCQHYRESKEFMDGSGLFWIGEDSRIILCRLCQHVIIGTTIAARVEQSIRNSCDEK